MNNDWLQIKNKNRFCYKKLQSLRDKAQTLNPANYDQNFNLHALAIHIKPGNTCFGTEAKAEHLFTI